MSFLEQPWLMPPPSAPTSFWEIFKHSWPILWEKPKGLIGVLAALSVVVLAFDQLSSFLKAPYEPIFEAFALGQQSKEEIIRALERTLAQNGRLRLALGLIIPFFVTPFSALLLSKVALNLWDGLSINSSDVGFALKRYHNALFVIFVVCVMGLLLAVGIFVAFFPIVICQFLFRNIGGGFMHIAMFFSFLFSFYLIIRFIWPIFRRFIFLEFITFFLMVDGRIGIWAQRVVMVFQALKFYPKHLNQAVGLLVCTTLALSLVIGIIMLLTDLAGLPMLVEELLCQMVYYIGTLWPLVALAGFYRLVLNPNPHEEEEEEEKN
ncbi:MAG: hypothetical protein LBT62_03260 [Deltaproteobacteria bacterium]|jgi:hypothetical protein|nr:hypothetical protein [Deltaproteobacteria bacterium]